MAERTFIRVCVLGSAWMRGRGLQGAGKCCGRDWRRCDPRILQRKTPLVRWPVADRRPLSLQGRNLRTWPLGQRRRVRGVGGADVRGIVGSLDAFGGAMKMKLESHSCLTGWLSGKLAVG